GGLPLLLHSILSNDYSAVEKEYEYQKEAESIRAALSSFFGIDNDETAIVSACGDLRDNTYFSGTPRQLLYADLIAAVCWRKFSGVSRLILPPASQLPLDAWTPALQKPRFPKELWPAQRRICDAGLLTGRSAIIQMPTSAGKTRATELIIRSAFLS